MSFLAIAYSQEDLSAAQRIAAAVEPDVEFEHYPVGRANDGDLLCDVLRKNRLPLVLLVSDSLLTNPNAMQGIMRILERDAPLLPVVIDAHRPDGTTGEIVTVRTQLRDRADVMPYVNHWQDRYIELRRAGDDYTDAVSQHAFKSYLRRIRETSVEAEESLEQLLALDPLSDAELRDEAYAPLYALAGLPQPGRQPQQEETLATSAGSKLAPEPEAAAAVVSRAWRMSDAGNFEEALEELAEAREAQPTDDLLQYQYALMLALAAGRVGESGRVVADLLERNPDYPDGLFLGGELCVAEGNHRRARQLWERLADLQPAYPAINQRLGHLLTDHFAGDDREAALYLARAVKETDVSPDTLYRYGELLAGPLDRPKKARKLLERVVALDAQNAAAVYRLAVLSFDRGDMDAARHLYARAVELEPAYDTPANRRAFHPRPQAQPPQTTDVPNDTLSALKKNIADLEAMLKGSEAPRAGAHDRPGTGKTVLLTGATSGIGLATARRLSREGYRLILAARREQRLEKLRRELREADGAEVHLLTLDVSRREDVVDCLAGLPDDFQRIDVLINNAGKAKGFDPIHTGDLDHWDEMIDVNLRGLLYVTRAVTPGMVARGTGMVINIASTAGKEVYPKGNVYCATKHAVDALTHAMRLDLVSHGIRVGQICPAHVEETEFAEVRFDGDKERAKIYEDFQPLRSRDVAEAIHFMVSQPPHVNVLDMVIQGTQQASSTVVDRSGRDKFAPKEE